MSKRDRTPVKLYDLAPQMGYVGIGRDQGGLGRGSGERRCWGVWGRRTEPLCNHAPTMVAAWLSVQPSVSTSTWPHHRLFCAPRLVGL